MFTKVTHISIFVHDQDEALAFYTQKLGLRLHTDVNIQGMRWLTVCLGKQPDFEIALMPADKPEYKALVGKQAADVPVCVFSTDDCQKTYKELKKRGVEFIQEPTEKPWGIEALFKDLYGNTFDVVQSK